MAVTITLGTILNTQSLYADPAGLFGEGDNTANGLIVYGNIKLTGSYPASGHGEVLDFSQFDQIKTNGGPRFVRIVENTGAGNAPLGYNFVYAQGTTIANGKLVIIGTPASGGATTGGTEFTAGTAYSSGTPSLSNAVLQFQAFFPSFT